MYVPAKERGGALQHPKSTLDEILEKINEKYKGDFTDADKVMLGALHDMLIAHPKLKSSALTTDPRIFSESIFSSAFGTAHGELYGLHCSRARCSHVGLGGDVTIGVMKIQCATNQPVTFQKTEYIRVGSYTKKLKDYPALQSRLWSRLHNTHFKDMPTREDLVLSEALRMIDAGVYFDLIGTPQPASSEGVAHYLTEEGIILRQDNGLYSITNLGAILFAKRLSDFPRISRKAIRVVQYKSNNRLDMLKEDLVVRDMLWALRA